MTALAVDARTADEPVGGASGGGRGTYRPEIQALRAAAVLGVVLFHLWPGTVRGGYAGVDVFFVISGFLITRHLVREAEAPGGIRPAAFWARRIRRLLPAALLVLAVTVVATYALVPQTEWAQFLRESVAAACYVENWQLAHAAVDYLMAQDPPSPAQHYWSLSVEEQFYLLWPLLVMGLAAVARRRSRPLLPVLRGGMLVVLVASLAASVHVTATDPAAAYFVTHTRAWEFALGGIVAVSPQVRKGFVGVLGWAALIGALLLYRQTMAFPGWLAILPAGGTALVVAAGGPTHPWARALVGNRLVQWVGTVSYSLYLWHWPLVVVVPHTGPVLGTWLRQPLILAAALGLATLSYRLVETPLRTGPLLAATRRSYAFALAGIVVVAALAAPGLVRSHDAAARSRAQADALTGHGAGGARCFGAAARLGDADPCRNADLAGVLLPRPIARKSDTGGAYRCYLSESASERPDAHPRVCHYGSRSAHALRVALVGDSHAASLIPGLRRAAARAGWSVDAMVANGGVLETAAPGDARSAYRRALLDRLTHGDYDLVLTTARRSTTVHEGSPDPATGTMAAAWREIARGGTRVVALADNPMLTPSASTCLDAADDLAGAAACRLTRHDAYELSDPIPEAAARSGAAVVDLARAYCTRSRCPLVVGHVIVYRDEHHITATFSQTLGPYLVDAVERAMGHHS